jgi:hypothetical protein
MGGSSIRCGCGSAHTFLLPQSGAGGKVLLRSNFATIVQRALFFAAEPQDSYPRHADSTHLEHALICAFIRH